MIHLPVHLYAVLYAHLNSSVNCIIYGLTNKQFRYYSLSHVARHSVPIRSILTDFTLGRRLTQNKFY